MGTTRTWGPVLLKVAESLDHWRFEPADRSDVDIYWEIVFAAAQCHSDPDFHERFDTRLEIMAEKLDARLASGWLNSELTNPQTTFGSESRIREIDVQNSPFGGELADKPVGAFWTSSTLSDGGSSWERVERSEFGSLSRTLRYFYFNDLASGEVFSIRDVDDYVELVLAHLRKTAGGRVLVDWRSAAQSYVAVHLTAAGLARAQNYRVETGLGVAELRGWDAESTAWLRVPEGAALSQSLR